MYDVIVVGAGPAGCSAARTLSEKGYRVLVAERHKMPRYKSCSGILIRKSMELIESYFGESVPDITTCLPPENKEMIFTDDKGNESRFRQEGLNIWRSSLDSWLAEKAAEHGAEIRDHTAAVSCRETGEIAEVTFRDKDTYTEKAKYVVDCEGVTGTLKRRLTGISPGYITTFQTFNEGKTDLDHHYFYAYLQPELSEYDAWFNVKDDLMVLGVSVRDTSRIEYFYKRFIDYMKDRHGLRIDRQTKAEKWLMPRISPGCGIDHGRRRILFAGETAGFLNPMGEGISPGLESGHSAACAVAENFGDPAEVLSCYRENTDQLKNYMKRQWDLVSRMSETFREMKSDDSCADGRSPEFL